MGEKTDTVRTAWFPSYSAARELLVILKEVPKSNVTGMIKAIWDQTGTPQNTVDWTDPAQWISERLLGEDADLAKRIWEESKGEINPRHIQDPYLFINYHKLLEPDSNGRFQLTKTGKAFIEKDLPLILELDKMEGLIQLLAILSAKTKAKRADLLPEWTEYLRDYSKFRADATIKLSLRSRLLNLVERGLVTREANSYMITPKGQEYVSGNVIDDPKQKLIRSLTDYNNAQVETLRERLGNMRPKAFEQLIGALLEAMGYEDVIVTKESGDKGVDVVATVQFGITTITEVVQVKRIQSNIARPILDQLRGALPYHKAIRGTLITLGNFSPGCKEAAIFPGAAPITLIDGKKLMELLVENGIGIRKRDSTIYEVDEDFFNVPDDQAQSEEDMNGKETA